MSSADDNVPEQRSDDLAERPGTPVPDHSSEIVMPPEEASRVIADIKGVAEGRGEDSEVHDLVELAELGTGPHPATAPAEQPEDDRLATDELRDAWPLLDLDERGDGLRVLDREDAE